MKSRYVVKKDFYSTDFVESVPVGILVWLLLGMY